MKRSDKLKVCELYLFGWGLGCFLLLSSVGCRDESQVASDESDEQNSSKVTVSDWPVFRGNSQMQGISIESIAPPLNLAWTFEAPYEGPGDRPTGESSPVVSGGKVFIGSLLGKFYCIDLESGEGLWTFEPEGGVKAPAAVDGDTVFFGDEIGFVYALSVETGVEKWRFETYGEIEGGINLFETSNGERRIVFGSHDASLYCVNAESGEEIWTYETDNLVVATPSLVDTAGGRVITFGGCDELLHILPAEGDQESGKREIEVGSYIASSTAAKDGIGYLAHNGGDILAIDIESGEMVWKVSTGAAYTSSPAVDEKNLYVSGPDKRLIALDRVTGDEMWAFLSRRALDSSPTIAGDHVWLGGMDGRLYAVSKLDGSEAWSFDLGTKIKSSPAVSRGTLVVGGADGVVYGFRK